MSEKIDEKIPVGWVSVNLGQLFYRLVNGGTPNTNNPSYWGGSIPWVTGADFVKNGIGEIRRFVTDAGVNSSSTTVVAAKNILLVTRTGVGKLAVTEVPTAISQDITGIYVDLAKAKIEYIFYLLEKEVENLKKLNQGTSINGIVRADLIRHQVCFPAMLEVQTKIANILQTIDEAIEKTEQLIEKYQQIKAGLMNDLFTRGIGADGKLRPPRAQAPELYHKTPIGWIPRDWDCELLDKVAVRGSGHTPSKSFPEYWDGGVKWISLADSHRLDKLYISETQFEISELGLQNSSAILHPPGIVVLSRDAGVGKSAITKAPMAVSQHFMCWRCDEKRMHNVFLYYWLQHNKRYFENIAMGSTILTIGLSYFKKLKIGVPSEFDEQKTIASSLLALEGKIFSMQSDLAKKKEVKSGLMHDLLTGKVSVSADLPVEPASPEEGAA